MQSLKEGRKYKVVKGRFPFEAPWGKFRRQTPEGHYLFDLAGGKEAWMDRDHVEANVLFEEVFVPRIYLASGWFNPEQKKQMDEVYYVLRSLCSVHMVEFFSPFYNGTVLKKDDPDLRKKMKETWDLDISEIEKSDMLIVCTQDHDVGTIFEAGYSSAWARAHGRTIPILCYNSKPELGLNLMLCQEARGFVKTQEDLQKAILFYCCLLKSERPKWRWNLWTGEPI